MILTNTLLYLFLLIFPSNDVKKVDQELLNWQYGRNDFHQIIDGKKRNFVLHVPESYTGDKAVPLVFMLHGTTGTGDRFYKISGWVQKAEKEGFIVVFPTARKYPIVEKGGRRQTKWSSGGLERVIPEGYPITDDVLFIKELVDLCKQTFNINKKKVYISGFSNGGGFVKSRVIPEMADVFAAASTGGGPGIPIIFPIKGKRYMPLFSIIGTRDHNVMERAGISDELPITGKKFLSLESIKKPTKMMLEMLEIDNAYTEEPRQPAYNMIIFNKDNSGQGNEMRYMIVKGLQHRYPNGRNNPHKIAAADHQWSWFNKFQLD